MNYWLITYSPHGSETNRFATSQTWKFYIELFDERFSVSDYFFMINRNRNICATGHVIEKNKSLNDNKNEYVVTIVRNKPEYPIFIEYNELSKIPELCSLMSSLDYNPIILTNKQARLINNFLGPASLPEPPSSQYVLGDILEKLEDDESFYVEYKEIKGKLTNIKNEVKHSFNSYLRSEGGKTIWGIRDSDKSVVGFDANYAQRDEIRKLIDNIANSSEPSINIKDYSQEFYPVLDKDLKPIPNKFVLELEIKRGLPNIEYKTPNGSMYVKTYSGKRKIS